MSPPFGLWSTVLGGFAIGQLIASAVFLNTSTLWFPLSLERDALWLRLAIVWLTVQVALGVLSVAVLRRASRQTRGLRGRARTIALGVVTALYTAVSSLSVGMVLWAALVAKGHVIGGSLTSLFFALTHLSEPTGDLSWVEPTFALSLWLQGAAAATILGLSISAWFLLPLPRRQRFWRAFDAVLVAAFVWATLTMPLSPVEGNDRSLLEAVIRVTVSTVFVVRLALRLLGPLLSTIERLGFRSMVAARHLRAKKSGFLAASGTLSILAVAVSSCMLITVLSVMGGFRKDLKDKILGNHAHIVVDRAHRDLPQWRGVLDQIRGAPGVAGATPFLQGEVLVTSLSNRAGAILRGIDAETIGDVTDLPQNVTQGKLEYLDDPASILQRKDRASGLRPLDLMLEAPPKPTKARSSPPEKPSGEVLPGLVVGQELARTLRLVVGDRVSVVSPRGELGPSGPIPKTRPFRVAAIFYSGMYEYDMKHAYADLEVAQRFLRAGDTITGVEVKVDDIERAPAIASTLATAVERPEFRVRDWKTLNQQLFGALALEKLAMFITLGIAILIAGFSVFGTLTLLVQDKRREVGILKAMGTSAKGVIRIFVLEGLLIGLAGALLGLGLGFVVTFGAEHFGIRMNPEVYYIDKLPVHLDPAEFTVVGVATVVVCLAATLFPAYQASRVRPVDALRYD